MNTGYGQFWMTTRVLTFDASRVIPAGTENKPITLNILELVRIL